MTPERSTHTHARGPATLKLLSRLCNAAATFPQC